MAHDADADDTVEFTSLYDVPEHERHVQRGS